MRFISIQELTSTMSDNRQPRRFIDHLDEPIKYGDVFPVQGNLAGEPIRPRDAALMQTAENVITGKTQKGGAAAAMQSAATLNERAGLVGHYEVTSDPAIHGVTVTETDAPGRRIIREKIAGQTVVNVAIRTGTPAEEDVSSEKITLGEALEAAGLSQSDRPVEQSDAAAIQAAEVRAIKMTAPGGVAAAAQSAADINARIAREEDKITVGEVLNDATAKLTPDKEVTREDAEAVVGAELRNRPDLRTVAGGIADSVTAAARLNEKMSRV